MFNWTHLLVAIVTFVFTALLFYVWASLNRKIKYGDYTIRVGDQVIGRAYTLGDALGLMFDYAHEHRGTKVTVEDEEAFVIAKMEVTTPETTQP
jgi:hypothetical protein